MDVERLLGFLGHSPTSDDFDDFLVASGITKRPKGDDDHSVTLTDPSKSVALIFHSKGSYTEYIGQPPKSEGWYALSEVELDRKFKGSIPFDLAWILPRERACQLLGQPVESDDSFSFHFSRSMLVVLRYASPKSDRLSSISFSVPRLSERRKYGLNET